MLIEVFQDFVCPWCFIGKRRLERALAERPRLPLEVSWRPYQLNPNIPAAGMDRRAYMAAKFGGVERAVQVYAMVAETAARDGLTLNLNAITRTSNTLDAHRLLRFLTGAGIDASAAADALFSAYFQRGMDLGRHEVLAAVAADMGADPQAAHDYLAGDQDRAAVRAADMSARQMGIQAVPCYVFGGRFALSGAQEPNVFLPLFDLAEAVAETEFRPESRTPAAPALTG